ncbi:MAG: hypothetical protein FWG45_05905 [Oscillospiraceae bacterium]|nr:hypothetical protein [Oscillospiraceae bacterium]
MTALEKYVREFCGIVKALKKDENGIIKGNFLFVSKDVLTALLNKHAYDTADNKLKMWRDVSWIIADDGHLTTYTRVKGTRTRLVKINLKAHECFDKILPKHDKKPSPQVSLSTNTDIDSISAEPKQEMSPLIIGESSTGKEFTVQSPIVSPPTNTDIDSVSAESKQEISPLETTIAESQPQQEKPWKLTIKKAN